MATQIHFGTSGWRAVMADEFTFANVRRAVTGIARYVVSQKPSGARVIVGRDPRFLGETFCAMASEILIAHGITPLMIAEPAPTPAISYAVIRGKTDGAINFTASHNPPEYNGIKFSTPDGAPALPEVTKRIEAEIAASDASKDQPKPRQNRQAHRLLEPRSAYLARLREIVDFKAIKKAESAGGVRSLLGRRAGIFRCAAARGWRGCLHRSRLSGRALRRTCARTRRSSARGMPRTDARHQGAHRHCHRWRR